jgi:hypothetical protein
MAGITIPKNHMNLGENLIVYVEDFHGKKVNIRKTYTKDGQDFVGKGLCISGEDWEDILDNIEDISAYVELELG